MDAFSISWDGRADTPRAGTDLACTYAPPVAELRRARPHDAYFARTARRSGLQMDAHLITRSYVAQWMTIGPRTLVSGARTYVMGVINCSPESFSGDGIAPSAG